MLCYNSVCCRKNRKNIKAFDKGELMDKKIRISRELVYVLAMLVMTLGVALMAKADFGVSMVVAPAYILSLHSEHLSFGRAEYCVQLLLVILMCVIVRRLKVAYFFTFFTAFIYGGVLDFMVWLVHFIPSSALTVRIVLCVIGAALISLGVALFFRTYLSPCAYDQFVKVVADRFKLDINKFKLIYDISSLAVSVILTFVFFGRLRGIGIATVVCAFINGYMIAFFGKLLDRRFTFFNRLKIADRFNII